MRRHHQCEHRADRDVLNGLADAARQRGGQDHAKGEQLVELFGKAQADSRKGADLGQEPLRSRLTG
ncbi:hypothetical protein ACFY6U_04415 [Streptomyces sp. NPDC013157]|uniref:hypothetical protein n=1 Tax=Streptomyces sp. NPDC013157 TaxID=3364861 RepID=UPI0036C83860